MNRLLMILTILLSLMSCNKTGKINEENTDKSLDKKFGEQIIKADYLKFTNSSKIDSMKNEIIKSFYIYDDSIYRFLHIDAEEIAEFNFNFFLPALNKILEKRDIHLNIELSDDYEKTNDIIINGEKINLYTESDLNKEIFWDTAPKNFFKKVNEILQEKGSNEQIYLLYDGNDLGSLILTKEQFEIIKERYINKKKEIPYLP